MTFAFGRQGREQVIRNIANLRTFEHGGISGRQGGTRRLNKLPREYAHGLENAVYVVYCYDTPIAWVVMDDDATEEGRVNFIPDWQYTATTTYHQGLVWEAWGKAVDPDPRFSARENRGTARGRSSDERYGRVQGRSPAQRLVGRGETSGRFLGQPSRTAPSGPPPSYLLDRRYADPDWVPNRDPRADARAEERDAARVMAEEIRRGGAERRAHP